MGRGPERSLVEPSILVGLTLGSNRDSVTSLGKMFPFDCHDGENGFLLFTTLSLYLFWKATLIKEKLMVIGEQVIHD